LKTSELIVLQIDTSSLRGKQRNNQQWGSGGQRSRPYDAEVRFGGMAKTWRRHHSRSVI